MEAFEFPVKLQEIHTINPVNHSDVIENKLAVVRQDTGKILGIVSKKYELLQHSTVIFTFRKALENIQHSEKISMIHDGAEMLAVYTIKNTQIEIVKDDIVSLQVVIKNSYNGANTLQMMLGAFRLVCSNGMILGKEFFTFRQKHIGSNVGFSIGTAGERIEEISSQFASLSTTFQKMNDTQVLSPASELYTPEIIALPKYLLSAAQDSYEKENVQTQWGFYNGLTNAITHSIRKVNPLSQIEFGKRAWEVAQTIQ